MDFLTLIKAQEITLAEAKRLNTISGEGCIALINLAAEFKRMAEKLAAEEAKAREEWGSHKYDGYGEFGADWDEVKF